MLEPIFAALETSVSANDADAVAASLVSSGLITDHSYLISRLNADVRQTANSPFFWAVVGLLDFSASLIDFKVVVSQYLGSQDELEQRGILTFLAKHAATLQCWDFEIPVAELEMPQVKRICRLLHECPLPNYSPTLLDRLLNVDLSKCSSEYRADVVWCFKQLMTRDNWRLVEQVSHAESKIELACFAVHRAFADETAKSSICSFDDCVIGASSANKNVRKQTHYLLVELFAFPHVPLFWAIQDALDQYASHLLKEIVTDVGSLTDVVPVAFIEQLWKRALTHENDSVRKFAISALVKHDKSDFVKLCTDAFITHSALPAMSAFVASLFGQSNRDLCLSSRTFLRTIAASRGRLVFEFVATQSPQAQLVLEVLNALQSVELLDWDFRRMAEFVTVTVTAYPVYLRPRMVADTLAIVKLAECVTHDPEFLQFIAVIPHTIPLPAELISANVDWNPADFAGRLPLRECVGRLRMCLHRASTQMTHLAVEHFAAECMKYVSRVYAFLDELIHHLVLLHVSFTLSKVTDQSVVGLVSIVCSEVLLPVLHRLLTTAETEQDIDSASHEELARLVPIGSQLLAVVKDQDQVRSLAVSVLCNARLTGFMPSAARVCLLDAVDAKLELDMVMSLEIDKSGHPFIPRSSERLSVIGQTIAWTCREEILDAFSTAKWRLVGLAHQLPTVEVLMGNLCTLGVNQVAPFVTVFNKVTSGGLNREILDTTDATAVLNTVAHLIRNRCHVVTTAASVKAMFDLAFSEACLAAHPEGCRSLFSKVLAMCPGTPGYGTALAACWSRLALNGEVATAFADLIAAILLRCEDQQEDGVLMASLLLSLSSAADAVVATILKSLKDQVHDWQRQKRLVCPLPESEVHKLHRNGWRVICVLLKQLKSSSQIERCIADIFELVSHLTQPDVCDMQDSVVCYLAVKWPTLMVPELVKFIAGTSTQRQSTQILAAGFAAKHGVEPQLLLRTLVPFLTANSALVRTQAQHWLSEMPDKVLGSDVTLKSLQHFVKTNKDTLQIMSKLQPVYARLDPVAMLESDTSSLINQLWLHPPLFMEEIKKCVREGMTEVVLTHDERVALAIAEAAKVTLGCSHSQPVLENVHFQRKYDPKGDVDTKPKTKKTELVILATFVDKVTNMAGLCRTAEIFGVRKLLVPQANVVTDSEFKAMSMTSEKWLEIEEVRMDSVAATLKQYRQAGYAIVALEQTSSSKTLGTWSFPRKTLLILGSEGQGIPVWCLADIDTTVEIPQLGVVRSLNVHVSAALAVWEYNKFWA